jgi:hypothetical protein
MRMNFLAESFVLESWNHATPAVADCPLAIAVEQAVRPLPLSTGRKARIRDDLFSHLKSIHEEEAAKGGTSDEIVARSLARFGAPSEISTELSGGNTWSQTLGWRISQALEFRISDSVEQFCFRFLVYVVSMMAVLSLVIWPAKWLLSGEYQPQEIGASAAALGLSSLLVTAMLYFGIKFADTMLNQRQNQVFVFSLARVHITISIDGFPRLAMAVWLLLLSMTYPAMYFAASYLHETYLLTHPDWVFLAFGAAGTTLVGLVAGFGFVADRRYREHWESLPIFSKEIAT